MQMLSKNRHEKFLCDTKALQAALPQEVPVAPKLSD
jgi:hypothetical protein